MQSYSAQTPTTHEDPVNDTLVALAQRYLDGDDTAGLLLTDALDDAGYPHLATMLRNLVATGEARKGTEPDVVDFVLSPNPHCLAFQDWEVAAKLNRLRAEQLNATHSPVQHGHVARDEFRCPECGEGYVDYLEFVDDDSDTVRCLTCGTVYKVPTVAAP
jgi:hypothetical protein